MGEENAETAYPPPYYGRIDLLAIAFPGTVYYVTGRGNTRQGIVADDRDRSQWLSVLAHVVDRYGWRCHAYCLMDNHYHLLIETPQPNLSLGMRQLNGRYTQAYNRRHARVGHLFQGRFTAILVKKIRTCWNSAATWC